MRLTAPPERVTLPVMEVAVKVPPRLSVPVESTWITSLAPLEDQVPAVVRLPVLAHSVPVLVQAVPVTVMVLVAVSALMMPRLARPRLARPTTPLWLPWMRMPAPISRVEPTSKERTTPSALEPPNTTSPVPLMACVPVPSSVSEVLLPASARVTLPAFNTRPPLTTLRSPPVLMLTLPELAAPLPSVMPLKPTVAKLVTLALKPPLVTRVAF